MARVAVVGAGVGGLASAIRLAKVGHQVTVFESNEIAGGKLASQTIDGFSFDTGPSLLTMPQLFDDLDLSFDRVRLPEPFAYNFADGSRLLIDNNDEATAASFEALVPGSSNGWRTVLEKGRRIWDISERTFFAGSMQGPWQLLKRMRSIRDFSGIDPLLTLNRRASRIFDDERLVQWLDRYATYSGSSPYRAPATLACIPFLENEYGAWHVPGGLATIATAMCKRAEELGVVINYNSPVRTITQQLESVTGVNVDDEHHAADIVVADIDARVLFGTLAQDKPALQRVNRAPTSTAGFAMLLGVKGKTPNLRHHNIWFTSDYRNEFRQIEENGVADEPTIYVCCSSITTSAEAPAGSENWFVLVNVKAGAQTDWTTYGDRIIERLGIAERIAVRRDLTPDYYAARYSSPGGAIYGTSSDGMKAAFMRANNRGPVRGLYVTGGSAHPGGGLPLVLSSARIVSDLVKADGWS